MPSTILPLVLVVAPPLFWSNSNAHADGAVMVPGTPNVTPHIGTPRAAGDPTQYPEPPSQLLPKLAICMGGGAVLAGGLLIAMDQDLDPRGPQTRYYYDTAGYGVVTLVVGALVAGTGVYFLLDGRARSAPTVAPVRGGGGVVGWTGRF